MAKKETQPLLFEPKAILNLFGFTCQFTKKPFISNISRAQLHKCMPIPFLSSHRMHFERNSTRPKHPTKPKSPACINPVDESFSPCTHPTQLHVSIRSWSGSAARVHRAGPNGVGSRLGEQMGRCQGHGSCTTLKMGPELLRQMRGLLQSLAVCRQSFPVAVRSRGRIPNDPLRPDARHEAPEHGPNMYRVNESWQQVSTVLETNLQVCLVAVPRSHEKLQYVEGLQEQLIELLQRGRLPGPPTQDSRLLTSRYFNIN